jgi:hypothetical protein
VTRLIAVALIAALTTLMLGINDVSWAAQTGQQTDRQREQVTRRLAGMHRGSTVEVTLTDGTKVAAVIQEIVPDAVTLLVDDRGTVSTRTVPVAEIREIRAVNPRKMSVGHKVLLGAAIAAGVFAVAILAACASAGSNLTTTRTGVAAS